MKEWKKDFTATRRKLSFSSMYIYFKTTIFNLKGRQVYFHIHQVISFGSQITLDQSNYYNKETSNYSE